MRKTIIMGIILSSFASTAYAETIIATINGLVCSFCATGIEKTFKAQPSVDNVKVDLETKFVTVNTKPNLSIDDATITKLITDAGYSVVGIERKK